MREAHEKGRSVEATIYTDGTYLARNASWHAEDSPWKARQIERILARNGLTPASVCEVGCGAGDVLKQLSRALPGATFDGYEVSPQAFELCRGREDERVHYHLKDLLAEEACFDCLLCIDVIEHVEDYLGFLKALKPKARHKVFHIPLDISALSVLRGSMLELRRRIGHIHYFTPETALAALRDCGYEIVDSCFTTPFDGLASPTVKSRLARVPRRILFSISPTWTARLTGGCSLLVLAR